MHLMKTDFTAFGVLVISVLSLGLTWFLFGRKEIKGWLGGFMVLVQVFPGKWVARVHVDVHTLARGEQMAVGIIVSWACRIYYLM